MADRAGAGAQVAQQANDCLGAADGLRNVVGASASVIKGRTIR